MANEKQPIYILPENIENIIYYGLNVACVILACILVFMNTLQGLYALLFLALILPIIYGFKWIGFVRLMINGTLAVIALIVMFTILIFLYSLGNTLLSIGVLQNK